MKLNTKKILILTVFIILNFIISNKIFAATLSYSTTKNSFGIGEQFYVDLMLDPEGQSVNAISSQISFPEDKLTLLRFEDGKSMISLWIDRPKQEQGNISFSGVMLNGFDGVIDPFNLSHKLPGLMIRLVFEAKNPGMIDLSTYGKLNLNDGIGTEISPSVENNEFKINDQVNSIKYVSQEAGKPLLEAYVTKDLDIYNNKYTLIFNATDKGVGIKNVMIKEGRRDWIEITSPYLLKDQSRHSRISLQAISYSGAGVSMNIEGVPYDWTFIVYIACIIISIIAIYILIFLKRKNERNN